MRHRPPRPQLRIIAEPGDGLTLDGLGKFMGDLAVAYDVLVLAAGPRYAQRVSYGVFRRDRRRPYSEDRLRVERLSLQSPLQLVVSSGPEHFLLLVALVLIIRYGDAYVRALGKRHGEIDADPLAQQKAEADIEHRIEQTRALRIENEKELRALGPQASLAVDGKLLDADDPGADVQHVLDRLFETESPQAVRLALERLANAPVVVLEAEVVSEPEKES